MKRALLVVEEACQARVSAGPAAQVNEYPCRVRVLAPSVLALVATLAVGTPPAGGMASSDAGGRHVPLRTVAKGSTTNPEETSVHVAGTRAATRSFLAHVTTPRDRERVLAVDFRRDFVVAAFVEGCSSGGWVVTIERAWLRDRRLYVSAALAPPSSGGIATYTTPYQVARASRTVLRNGLPRRWTLIVNGEVAARDGTAFKGCGSFAPRP